MNLAKRRSDVLVRHIDNLHAVIKTVKNEHQFAVLALVVLPEHQHAIWRLAPGDANYPCWSPIKAGFSRRLPKTSMPAAKITTLFAALNMRDGKVLSMTDPLHRQQGS